MLIVSGEMRQPELSCALARNGKSAMRPKARAIIRDEGCMQHFYLVVDKKRMVLHVACLQGVTECGSICPVRQRWRQLPPDKFECIGGRRSAWCRKAELSGR